MGGKGLVFDGGSTAVTSTVQDVTQEASTPVISQLPQPRADLVAISDGRARHALGGYDGTQGSTTVLRTLDGRALTVMDTLPLSVRSPAIAATAGSLWLFGGEHDGKQVTDVQRIDLTTGHASLAGYLQGPLAHAGAFILGGRGPGRRRVQRRLGDRRCHALRPLEHEPDGRWTPTRGPVRLRCRSG